MFGSFLSFFVFNQQGIAVMFSYFKYFILIFFIEIIIIIMIIIFITSNSLFI